MTVFLISFLKTFSKFLSKYLAYFINRSFVEGTFPEKLKHAVFIPLHKRGSKTELNKYRPFLLPSCISKIFEKCVHIRVVNFFEENSVFQPEQFGFREKLSTSDALLLFSELVRKKNRDEKNVAIFLDLKKAFDTVDHKIVLKKLELSGIRGPCLKWFTSYLNKRTQVTFLENIYSNPTKISIGVPQGSVLGPLLFILYINDLKYFCSDAKCIMFADDTSLIFKGKYDNQINTTIKAVMQWLNANRLSLNILKTSYIVFREKDQNYQPIEVFQKKSVVKYLGVKLDNELKISVSC